MYNLEAGVFMYRYFEKLLPESFNAFFTKRSDIHNYHTRNSSNLNHTRNRKVFADKTIRTTGPKLWNSLNDQVKKSLATKLFRNSYKSTLINQYI